MFGCDGEYILNIVVIVNLPPMWLTAGLYIECDHGSLVLRSGSVVHRINVVTLGSLNRVPA